MYEQTLSILPSDIEALHGIGLVYSAQGHPTKAKGYFEQILKVSDDAVAKAELGWCEHELGRTELAIEYVQDAAEKEPENATIHLKLGKLLWSLGDEVRRDREKCFASFIQAAKLDPKFPDAFNALGDYYQQIVNDIARATKCYQKAYELDPNNADAAYNLTSRYLAKGDYKTAENTLRIFVQVSSKVSWAWRRLGFLGLSRGDSLNAISSFQNALKADINDLRSWEGLSDAYLKQGRYVAALKVNKRIAELDPDNLVSLYGIGEIQKFLGHYNESIAAYSQLAQLAMKKGQQHLYILGQIGTARSHYLQAKENFHNGAYGDASQCLWLSIDACLLVLSAETLAWKLMGDALLLLTNLGVYAKTAENQSCLLKVQEAVSQAGFTTEKRTDSIDLPALLALETYCACSSDEKSSFDIALAHYTISKHEGTGDSMKVGIGLLVADIKCSPSNDSLELLGAMLLDKNPLLSQHCLIKSMQQGEKSSKSWEILGFLAYRYGEYEFAKKMFSTAYETNTESKAASIGQAMVTMKQGQNPASYFEHALAIDTGSHCAVGLSYAKWLLTKKRLMPESTDCRMALFYLQKHLELQPDDAVAWNLLAMVFEIDGQIERALRAILRCTELPTSHSLVRVNLTRMLVAGQHFQPALQVPCDTEGLSSRQLAAHHRARGTALLYLQQLEDALAEYETMNGLLQNDYGMREDASLLVSQVIWSLGMTRDLARRQVQEIANADFQCCACAMALVAGDIDHAVQEIAGILADIEMEQLYSNDRISMLMRGVYLLNEEPNRTMHVLLQVLHVAPSRAQAWANASLLFNDFDLLEHTHVLAEAAGKQALLAGDAEGVAQNLLVRSGITHRLDNTTEATTVMRALFLAPSTVIKL